VKAFVRDSLFDVSPVDLEDPMVLRNLSEPEAGKLLFDTFRKAINALTVQESGETRVEGWIRLSETRPFRTDRRPYLAPARSVFNRIVGEANAGGFELTFAAFLERAGDVASFAKNYPAVNFKLDYVKADGDLANYTPDFIVRTSDGTLWVIETKGRQEIDVPRKMARLAQWCADATGASTAEGGPAWRFAFVDQTGFERYTPDTMATLATGFTEYQS
jgi:type III restriction enzyme